METQIRPIRAEDLTALVVLAQQTYRAAYGHEMDSAALSWHLETYLSRSRLHEMMQHDVFLLAEQGAQLIGYVQFGATQPTDPPADEVEIRRLYVLPVAQNQGLGSRLMKAALAHPQVQAAGRAVLGVWHTNTAAQRFYARFGFVQIGEQPYLTQAGDIAGVDLLLCRRQIQD
ncbi:GNAT family N-acetyltransferase [Deinococcus sp. KNUC1210]|uniref:GNAT family N-acetyltransferase n=1 Tax=Deinococcus sp. KNUC1210 TaxID=2917691 RepID=UPI001EF01D1A|nr:GNAT family N-acetyltransferase [Deinococcus sp. KNUC1210]ULH16196.1 GNAT family N-acetyltransferase [Deinococcus sp. KNUC1210]